MRYASGLDSPKKRGENMPKELRCRGTMHAILTEENELEVRCKRRSCGSRSGVVVLHTFNLTTGKLTQTRHFADPVKE